MEAGAKVTRPARLRERAVSPETFLRLSAAALVALFVIVLSGASVRLTGSGLGCEGWPRCGEGSFLPAKDFHAYVEFGNRVVGVLVGLVTLAAAVAAWRVPRLPRWLVLAAAALPASVLLQGVLGGVTVLVELHPLIVMSHFLLSLVAIALATVVTLAAWEVARAPRGPDRRAPATTTALSLALVPSALALVVTGTLVTAAGPHSGGEDIERFGILGEALHIHVGATAVFGLAFLALLAGLVRERARAGAELVLGGVLLVVLVGQMALGEVQWRSGLPWGLVLVHVGAATAVWTGVVALAARHVVRGRTTLA